MQNERKAPAVAPILLAALALGIGGCQQGASSLNASLKETFFRITASLLVVLGGIGLALAVDVSRRRVSRLTLVACWLVCAPVLILTLQATELYFPWPGTFRPRDLVLLWPPQTFVIAALIASARFIGERAQARPSRVHVAALLPIAVHCALLANASRRGLTRPAVSGAIVQVAVLDSVSFQRSDRGVIVAWAHELPGRYRTLRASSTLALAVDESGGLYELSTRRIEQPVPVETQGVVTDIAAAGSIGCFSDAEGVWCFDRAAGNGKLGRAPSPIEGLAGASTIAMSATMACGILAGGRAACAPLNDLRLALFEGVTRRTLVNEGAVAIAASKTTACVLVDGRVSCASDAGAPAMVPIEGSARLVEVVAGAFHFCAREEGGRVLCWGGNGWRQLGPATQADASEAPVVIPLASPAVELFAQPISTCARLESGEIHCWGAQKEPGAVISGDLCDDPLFGSPTICSAVPQRVSLATTAVPFRE